MRAVVEERVRRMVRWMLWSSGVHEGFFNTLCTWDVSQHPRSKLAKKITSPNRDVPGEVVLVLEREQERFALLRAGMLIDEM